MVQQVTFTLTRFADGKLLGSENGLLIGPDGDQQTYHDYWRPDGTYDSEELAYGLWAEMEPRL